MKRLWQIEMKKALNYKVFWIIFVLHLLLVTITSLFIRELIDAFQISSPNKGISIQSGLSVYLFFPKIWNTMSYIAGFWNALLALIVIVSVCDEFSFSTFRQSIMSGLTKQQFVLSKTIVCVVLSIYSSILILIFGLIFGFINTQNPSVIKIIAELQFIPLYFLQTLAYLMFAMFLSFFLRKSALTITMFFVYILIIENLVRVFIKHPIGNYFPGRTISRLVPMPDHLQQAADSVPLIYVVASFAYIFVFWGLSTLALNKMKV